MKSCITILFLISAQAFAASGANQSPKGMESQNAKPGLPKMTCDTKSLELSITVGEHGKETPLPTLIEQGKPKAEAECAKHSAKLEGYPGRTEPYLHRGPPSQRHVVTGHGARVYFKCVSKDCKAQ